MHFLKFLLSSVFSCLCSLLILIFSLHCWNLELQVLISSSTLISGMQSQEHGVHYWGCNFCWPWNKGLSSWCALQQTMTIFLVYPLFIFRCAKTLNSFVTGFPAFRVVIPLLNAVSTKKIFSKLAVQFNLESWLLKLFLFINWLTALGFQKFYLCVPTKKSCIVLWFSDTLSPSYH